MILKNLVAHSYFSNDFGLAEGLEKEGKKTANHYD
jgi:hypothetical protein